jgi:hypothetical protein
MLHQLPELPKLLSLRSSTKYIFLRKKSRAFLRAENDFIIFLRMAISQKKLNKLEG